MLEESDIRRLTDVLVSKIAFDELKEDIQDIRDVVHGLVTAVDKIARSIENLHHEYIAIKL
jgi:hypothetical protein